MSIQFSKVRTSQFQEICKLYQDVIADMQKCGLKQWTWGVYPTAAQLEEDIARGDLYRVDEDGALAGAFVLAGDLSEEYSSMEWHYGVKPATLHRFAMLPGVFGTQMAHRVLTFVKEEALRAGFDSLHGATSFWHSIQDFRGKSNQPVVEYPLRHRLSAMPPPPQGGRLKRRIKKAPPLRGSWHLRSK